MKPQVDRKMTDFAQQVYAEVARIPKGQVATYGQIARRIGYPKRARQVGQALAATPVGVQIPWHRVINAQGRLSARPGVEEQAQRLLAEGVPVKERRVPLRQYAYMGASAAEEAL